MKKHRTPIQKTPDGGDRSSLATVLHDTVAQQLTGVGMLAFVLAERLKKQGGEEAAMADNLLKQITATTDQMRGILLQFQLKAPATDPV